MTQKIIHAYWPFAGFAQPNRYVLAYCDALWEDKIYLNRQQWFNKDKLNMGLLFPNLPYLIDGKIKITQSNAILRYLPKRFGKPELLGKNILDQAEVDIYLGVISDIMLAFVNFVTAHPDNWMSLKSELYEQIKLKLDLIEKNVDQEGWSIGYLTVVDFRLADFTSILQVILPDHFKSYPKLAKIRENVFKIPQIKNYRQHGITHLFPPKINQ